MKSAAVPFHSSDDSPGNDAEFSLRECRELIGDLFQPRPWIYWTDFLLSYSLGVYCFHKVRGSALWESHQGFLGTFEQTFFFFASCLLFYRAGMFIHEVVHQRAAGRLPVFRFVWNVLCGIPFLIPSFIYYPHIDHHRRQHFGTSRDGEYLPLEQQSVWQILFYLSWCVVIPILAIVRFLVLTPLAWLIPGFRSLVHQHASSMVMDPSYIRPLPKKQTLRLIYLQELACFLWCFAIAIYGPVFKGQSQAPFLIHAYLMAVVIVFLNSVRTIGSHRFFSTGEPMSFLDQLRDSVNYPRHAWISELWGPVGTRFHALHHLFPSLPYHSFPAAHRRLMASLPQDSPYRLTEESSLTSALLDLWRRNRQRASAAGTTSGADPGTNQGAIRPAS
jgi:fatty acid desaturase